jgi:hypothetical protein
MTGRGDRSIKFLFSLEAFWHFRNGKLSDLSFEFLFYRKTVNKTKSTIKFLFAWQKCKNFLLIVRSIFQHLQRITLSFG